MRSSTNHFTAAEHALREFAQVSHGKAGERAARSATVLAWMAQLSDGRPVSEGATARSELVDALLDGADALRWKAGQERQAAVPASRQQSEREARAAEYERYADAILELDSQIGGGRAVDPTQGPQGPPITDRQ